MLDGGIGTELPRAAARARRSTSGSGASAALVDAPDAVLRVHRRYVEAGCDVVTTNTWGLPTALADADSRLWELTRSVHWMDVARRGLRLARAGGRRVRVRRRLLAQRRRRRAGRRGDDPAARAAVRRRAARRDPARDAVARARRRCTRRSRRCSPPACPCGSRFRRCRHGLCGVYGEHWGGPEGDAFGRAARRFEEIGVRARCWSTASRPTTSTGWSPTCATSPTCRSASIPTSATSRTTAGVDLGVGGAGVRGDGAAAGAPRARRSSAAAAAPGPSTSPRRARPCATARPAAPRGGDSAPSTTADRTRPRRRACRAGPTAAAARCTRCRSPTSSCEPGVARPRRRQLPRCGDYLFREAIGAHQRCLDLGCGTGLLAVQLALNGAAHVRAIDVDERAVANTLDERVPQRRRGPDQRRGDRPVPVGARGALRGDRREPAPDAGRPVPPGRRPPPGRLLGPRAARPGARQAARGARAGGRRPTSSTSRSLSQARTLELLAARGLEARVVDQRPVPVPRGLRGEPHPDRPRRGAERRLPRCASASTTCSSPTCSRSGTPAERVAAHGVPLVGGA